jgi:hypothetical protein
MLTTADQGQAANFLGVVGEQEFDGWNIKVDCVFSKD